MRKLLILILAIFIASTIVAENRIVVSKKEMTLTVYNDSDSILLKTKIDINSVDGMFETPLIAAASGGHTFSAKLLIEAGANVNFKNKSGRTALHAAAAGGDINTIRLLLQKNALPNVRDISNNTPRSYAIVNGHNECAKLLYHAEVNQHKY